MDVERYLRLIAGFFILSSLALSRLHSEYCLFFYGLCRGESFSVRVHRLVPHDGVS